MKFITLILIPTIIGAHSWAACTNYNTQDTNYLTFGKFDHSKCLGYPRAYQAQLAAELAQTWGTETGYDWEHEQCRSAFDNSEYSDATPMAIYYSGEIIHISHPAKNHVADSTYRGRGGRSNESARVFSRSSTNRIRGPCDACLGKGHLSFDEVCPELKNKDTESWKAAVKRNSEARRVAATNRRNSNNSPTST